jgi:hypothetical protein
MGFLDPTVTMSGTVRWALLPDKRKAPRLTRRSAKRSLKNRSRVIRAVVLVLTVRIARAETVVLAAHTASLAMHLRFATKRMSVRSWLMNTGRKAASNATLQAIPCAEHVQQLGSVSLLSNLMEVKD